VCCAIAGNVEVPVPNYGMMFASGSHSPRLILAITLIAVASWSSSKHPAAGVRTVAGQGLAVGSDNLGAGAEATATEFELFEDSLHLSTTGGKGRGGRGAQLIAAFSACIQFMCVPYQMQQCCCCCCRSPCWGTAVAGLLGI
jgi:hypothetical protein